MCKDIYKVELRIVNIPLQLVTIYKKVFIRNVRIEHTNLMEVFVCGCSRTSNFVSARSECWENGASVWCIRPYVQLYSLYVQIYVAYPIYNQTYLHTLYTFKHTLQMFKLGREAMNSMNKLICQICEKFKTFYVHISFECIAH